MIRFANELIDELNRLKKIPTVEIKVNGVFDIDSVGLVKDNISINADAYCSHEDLDDKISELESEIDDLNSQVNGCQDALNLVCDRIDDIQYYMKEYMKVHPEEAEILTKLDTSVLEDFVKTSIDWYNIKGEVESEC